MIHPDTFAQQTNKGLGVFTRRPFRKGEILWIADDIDVKIDLERYNSLDPVFKKRLDIYSYLDYTGQVVIAWDEGKYVNHSCDPNIGGILEYDNLSIALRDIAEGEEVVEDYCGYFGHFETFTCRCGSPNCRKIISHENSYQPELRLHLKDMAELILSLPQPLLNFDFEENRDFIRQLETYRK